MSDREAFVLGVLIGISGGLLAGVIFVQIWRNCG